MSNNNPDLLGPDEPGLKSSADEAFNDMAALEVYRAGLEELRGTPVGIVEAATQWGIMAEEEGGGVLTAPKLTEG